MSLQSTLFIEAALFNEHTLIWEPLIEPAVDSAGNLLSPWGLKCTIKPVSLSLFLFSAIIFSDRVYFENF